MRDRPPSPRPLLVGIVLAACALSINARPGAAFVNCCRIGSFPPTLTSFHLTAGSAEDGLRRAAALGFRARIDDAGEAVVALDRASLAWKTTPMPHEHGAIPAPNGYPVVSSTSYFLCYPAPDRPAGSRRDVEHPNGALEVTGALALVLDMDAACGSVERGISRLKPDLGFGRDRSHEALGARSRTGATDDGTTITLLVAGEGDGPAARWLAQGGARWLGVTVSVRDLDEAARWLAHGGASVERLEIDGIPCLLAEPDGPGGAIVVFHPADQSPFGRWGPRWL